MTASRSEIIREVETDLMQARARGLLRHKGITYTEYKQERAKKRMQVYKVLIAAVWVLVIVAVALKAWSEQ